MQYCRCHSNPLNNTAENVLIAQRAYGQIEIFT